MVRPARFFIGGCNVAFKLPPTGFAIADPSACVYKGVCGGKPMVAIERAESHPTAIEICRTCPHATVQPHLEKAPDVDAARSDVQSDVVDAPWTPESTEPITAADQAELEDAGWVFGPADAPPSDPLVDTEANDGYYGAAEDYAGTPNPRDELPAVGDPDILFDPTQQEAWDGGSGGTPMRVPPSAQKAPTGAPTGAGAKRPTLDSLLNGIEGGPSIFGQSTVRVARQCLRLFFYKFVLGLFVAHEPGPRTLKSGKIKLSPLEVGIGVHAVGEVYYKALFDAVAALGVLNPVKAVYPALAVEITRLWNFYLQGFHKLDSTTWDVRGVELESRFFYPKRKCRGSQRSLCISARHDTIVRTIGAGDARLPSDERADDGVYIHDLKTIAQISDGAVRAWRHEPQGLQNLLCWRDGYTMESADPERGLARRLSSKPAVERYGNPNGLIITHIGKAIEQDPVRHLKRTKYVIPGELIDSYRDETGDYLYEQVFDRLFHKDDVRLAVETWPRSFLACRDPMTNRACDYLPLCETNCKADPERLNYVVGRTLDPKLLLQPKRKGAGKKKRKAGAQGDDK